MSPINPTYSTLFSFTNLHHRIAKLHCPKWHYGLIDYVTASSWGEFWLTEGFVRFMDQKVVDIYKDCDQNLLLQTTIFNNALWGDDDISAKPLYQEIKKPDDVYNILNYITYEKGCSVLMMLEKLIGERVMQQIIQAYIKQYQYQSVNSQEFVACVQSFVNFDVSDFLDDFITQSGYPLITVELSENKSQVILLQEQFLRSVGKSNNGSTKRWTIPITFITDIDLDPKTIWFNSNEEEVVITFPAEIRWIKLNLERSGYYRVNYPRQMWRYFSRIVKYLDVKDRINLIDDSMALVRSGHLHCSIAFSIMNYLYHEDLYEVWKVAENNFNTIYNGLVEYELDTSYLKTYISELIDKQYRDNTWTVNEAETFRIRNTRKTIFSIACFYGHEDCLRFADELSTIEEMLPDDIIDILTASGVRKNKNMQMLEIEWEMLSFWFGADLSVLSKDNKFIWSKQTIENCNRWLKDQYEI